MLPAGWLFLLKLFCVKIQINYRWNKGATNATRIRCSQSLFRVVIMLYITPLPFPSTNHHHWCTLPPAGFESAHHRHSWTSCTWPLSLCVHTVQSLGFEFGPCTLDSPSQTVASGSLMLPIGKHRPPTHNQRAGTVQMAFSFEWIFTVFLPRTKIQSKFNFI